MTLSKEELVKFEIAKVDIDHDDPLAKALRNTWNNYMSKELLMSRDNNDLIRLAKVRDKGFVNFYEYAFKRFFNQANDKDIFWEYVDGE